MTNPLLSGYPGQYGPQVISADKGWRAWTLRNRVIIAIVDSGVDYTHPDLTNKILHDASGNILGCDSITTGVAVQSSAQDKYGHGTHVAGIAAAQTNNDPTNYTTKSVAGIAAWNGLAQSTDVNNVKIMPIKVCGDADGRFTYGSLANGIKWAVDNCPSDAKLIINMSLYTDSHVQNQMVSDAVAYAWNDGAILVGIAGNDGNSLTNYPAGDTNVMSVAATDNVDKLAGYSNYNPSSPSSPWVFVAAPGGGGIVGSNDPATGILSTVPVTKSNFFPHTSYDYDWGTSMAAPHVSGEAALIASQCPTLVNAQINEIIAHCYDPATPYSSSTNGVLFGRVNVYKALRATGAARMAPDFNTDGYADLVYRYSSSGKIINRQLSINGSGLPFAGTTTTLLPNTGANVQVAGVVDLDADGLPDIAYRDTSTNAITFGLLNSNGTTTGTILAAGTRVARLIGFADFDHDGNLDALVQYDDTRQVDCIRMHPNPNSPHEPIASAPVTFNGGTPGSTLVVVGMGDLNGDGFTDLVYRDASNGNISYQTLGINYTTRVPQGLGYNSLLSAGTDAQVVGVADLNADGYADLVFQYTSTGTVSYARLGFSGGVLSIVGSGTIAANLGTDPRVVGVVDLNVDSYPDLLFQYASNGKVTAQLLSFASGSLMLGGSSVLYTGDTTSDHAILVAPRSP